MKNKQILLFKTVLCVAPVKHLAKKKSCTNKNSGKSTTIVRPLKWSVGPVSANAYWRGLSAASIIM